MRAIFDADFFDFPGIFEKTLRFGCRKSETDFCLLEQCCAKMSSQSKLSVKSYPTSSQKKIPTI